MLALMYGLRHSRSQAQSGQDLETERKNVPRYGHSLIDQQLALRLRLSWMLFYFSSWSFGFLLYFLRRNSCAVSGLLRSVCFLI